MRITSTVDYAVRGVLYLAVQPDGRRVLLNEIAAFQEVPKPFLGKIFQSLVKAGILRSYRGTNGGFILDRPQRKVTLRMIIEAVDGPLSGHYTLFEPPTRGKYVTKVEKVYSQAINQAKAVFQKTKLSDLIK